VSPFTGDGSVRGMEGVEEEGIRWKEPEGEWVDVILKSDFEGLMHDLRTVVRLWGDTEKVDELLTDVFNVYGAKPVYAYEEEKETIILIPAVKIFHNEIHSAIYITDFEKAEKKKMFLIVSMDKCEIVEEDDEDFETLEEHWGYLTDEDTIEPSFILLEVR